VEHDAVIAWVAGYEEAWRAGSAAAVKDLFTEDAQYRPSPYEPSEVGHEAIQQFWCDDEGKSFEVRSEPVAVEAQRAVVRVDVDYLEPLAQQYRNLWILDFAADGRVREFEEWAYWPGLDYSATNSG
jgi:ketosteroid isomerase-like protein